MSSSNRTPEQFSEARHTSATPLPIPSHSHRLEDPISRAASNDDLDSILSVSVPRKRRRGRPPHSTPFISSPEQSNLSDSFTHLGNELGSSLSSEVFSVTSLPDDSSSSSSIPPVNPTVAPTVRGAADEIIVINKEATAEASVALTAGFPADTLTEEEIEACVLPIIGGIEQVNYTLIRNHIITKWRENVSNSVTREMIVDSIPSHCSNLLDSAYNFLVTHGYINFGVAPSIKGRIFDEHNSEPPNVIIIGAGLSGLAAARQLISFGFKVTVLEARKRPGGRVYTKKMEGGNRSAAADLGGSVLTGTLGNPLGILSRQLSHSLHKVRDGCPLYRSDGMAVDSDTDKKVEATFNRLLDKASRLRQLMGDVSVDVSLGSALETFRQVYEGSVDTEEMSLFNWHLANLEYANAGLLSRLSLAFWDQDDPFDMGGDHCFLPGGNGQLVQALAESVPILYERTVNAVRHSSEGVQVVAGRTSQVFNCDMALCTVPLGVLKNGCIQFEPELPQRKLDSIRRLGFGLLNKVAMLFPDVFWDAGVDTFGHLSEDPSRRGEFFLFYSYAAASGGPLLTALVAGEAAHEFETMPPTEAVARVLRILRGIYGPRGIRVPEPVQTVCTRWGGDPYSLGSYSNVAVGASGDDYDVLGECVSDGRLFFAGEATSRRYPATMHGAFLSGLREAANMARYAGIRVSKLGIEAGASVCASVVADLFRDPDLVFGSFAVVCGGNDSDAGALVRIALGGSSRRRSNCTSKKQEEEVAAAAVEEEVHIYTVLSKRHALNLREVRGGDDARLNYLCGTLGVKLIGRKGLGPSAHSLIASITAERAVQKSPPPSSTLIMCGIPEQKSVLLEKKMIRRAKIVRNINTGISRDHKLGATNRSDGLPGDSQ